MASRRRYKPPKGYERGGRVVHDGASSHSSLEPPVASADVPLAPAEPVIGAEPSDAVARALGASVRADTWQRAAQGQASPEETIAAVLPGLSPHKYRFLAKNQDLLTDKFKSQAMQFHYRQALGEGIEDDTPEMDARILSGVRDEIERQRQSDIAAANAGAALLSDPPSAHSPDELTRRSLKMPDRLAALDQIDTASEMTPLGVLGDLPPPPAPAKRSIPIAAPVSRNVPTPSGQRPMGNQITLTPLEREIARNSFGGNMTNAEKERLYAQNKAKLQRMRASGEYRQTTEREG